MKPKAALLETVIASDSEVSANEEEARKGLSIEIPVSQISTAGTSTTNSAETGEDKDDKIRNKTFSFTQAEKGDLYQWLVSNEIEDISHKVFHKITEEHLKFLTDKSQEFSRGDAVCEPVQLYNFFKSNRRIYTDYLNLIKASGSAAVDNKDYTKFQREIIKIYQNHSAKTGVAPVTRKRATSSKVSIS